MKQLAILALVGIAAANAQWGYGNGNDRIRAQIRGGGGDSGKCTAEVEVDGVADIAISGADGYLRTLQGDRARWRRLVCTGPLPRDAREFRFRGIDGRGRQYLVRDPRSNRGTAVVRIEDQRGGREGYTFDIEWRGYRGGTWGRGDRNFDAWPTNVVWDKSENGAVYRGEGRGDFYRHGGQRFQIYDVDVTFNRASGQVNVVMDTNLGRDALTFRGQVNRYSGDTIYAELRRAGSWDTAAGATGLMQIGLDRNRRVEVINMNGTVAGGHFTLAWRD